MQCPTCREEVGTVISEKEFNNMVRTAAQDVRLSIRRWIRRPLTDEEREQIAKALDSVLGTMVHVNTGECDAGQERPRGKWGQSIAAALRGSGKKGKVG